MLNKTDVTAFVEIKNIFMNFKKIWKNLGNILGEVLENFEENGWNLKEILNRKNLVNYE